jgi:hypothetical protein
MFSVSVVAAGIVVTGIGVAVDIAVGIGEATGGSGEVAVGAAVTAGFDEGTGVTIGLASLVADIAARTIAAISGVGATVMGAVGAWVGSAAQEVANRARMTRANTMNGLMETVTPRNTESPRR